jgi:hypothetical protein
MSETLPHRHTDRVCRWIGSAFRDPRCQRLILGRPQRLLLCISGQVHPVPATHRETIAGWYEKAVSACDPFIFPESRFRNAWMDDDRYEKIQVAMRWLDVNPCPDESVGEHLHATLKAYADMRVATVGRLTELREIIELHSKFVDRRNQPRAMQSTTAPTSGNLR